MLCLITKYVTEGFSAVDSKMLEPKIANYEKETWASLSDFTIHVVHTLWFSKIWQVKRVSNAIWHLLGINMLDCHDQWYSKMPSPVQLWANLQMSSVFPCFNAQATDFYLFHCSIILHTCIWFQCLMVFWHFHCFLTILLSMFQELWISCLALKLLTLHAETGKQRDK